MNEKLQYASMLEIPVSTCNITHKPLKKKMTAKRKKVNGEEVKMALMNKVNQAVENQAGEVENTPDLNSQPQLENTFTLQAEEHSSTRVEKIKRFKGKFSLVTVQLIIIGALISAIAFTNIFNENSGLNTFFRSVFGEETQTTVTDQRLFSDFAPVIEMETFKTQEKSGIMTFEGEESVYSTCDGTVKSLVLEKDGTYTMEVAHSDNFVSVLKGMTVVYSDVGDTVYSNIPVGYFKEDLQMTFTNSDGAVITNYKIVDGSVVWSV